MPPPRATAEALYKQNKLELFFLITESPSINENGYLERQGKFLVPK